MNHLRVRRPSGRKATASAAAMLLAGVCAVLCFAGPIAASASDARLAKLDLSSSAKLKPRPTSTPTATPTATAIATPTPTASTTPTSTASSTSSPSICTALLFNGQSYCAGTISGVKATIYGLGQRIALRQVSVSAIDPVANTIQVWGFDPCPAGMYCGQGSVTLTVAWNESAKPMPGDDIDLYGVTITSSLRVDGYVQLG
jgi:hypothetical protein